MFIVKPRLQQVRCQCDGTAELIRAITQQLTEGAATTPSGLTSLQLNSMRSDQDTARGGFDVANCVAKMPSLGDSNRSRNLEKWSKTWQHRKTACKKYQKAACRHASRCSSLSPSARSCSATAFIAPKIGQPLWMSSDQAGNLSVQPKPSQTYHALATRCFQSCFLSQERPSLKIRL